MAMFESLSLECGVTKHKRYHCILYIQCCYSAMYLHKGGICNFFVVFYSWNVLAATRLVLFC